MVLCLFALLSGFFLNCFVFAMNQYHHSIALMELEDNLGNAMDWLSADLADTIAVLECKADGLSLQTAEKKIYYTTGTDTQAKEHFYDLTGKIFYRREHTQKNRQPMANFITGFYITYYDEQGTLTSYAANVKMVDILLEGTWHDTVLSKTTGCTVERFGLFIAGGLRNGTKRIKTDFGRGVEVWGRFC